MRQRRNLQGLWWVLTVALVWLALLMAWRHNLGWTIWNGVVITLMIVTHWDWKNNNGTQGK